MYTKYMHLKNPNNQLRTFNNGEYLSENLSQECYVLMNSPGIKFGEIKEFII